MGMSGLIFEPHPPYSANQYNESLVFSHYLTKFKSKKNIKVHRDLHAGIRYRCHLCSVSFSQNDRLLNHVKKKHPNTPPLLCKTCGKTFLIVDKLNEHLLRFKHGSSIDAFVNAPPQHISSVPIPHPPPQGLLNQPPLPPSQPLLPTSISPLSEHLSPPSQPLIAFQPLIPPSQFM